MADQPIAADPGTSAEGDRLDGATTVMDVPSMGDTGEFLRILSESSPAAAAGAAQPISSQPGDSDEAKPIVIKGGPRRVVRADGRAPEMSFAMGQRRFSLSSGHEMFAPKKRRHLVLRGLFALAIIALVVGGLYVVWHYGQGQITLDKQHDVVGTSGYDGSLSVTPANDGGYYTVFFVTSTPTNEDAIGSLAETVMYRCDKGVTGATRITVPRDLAVSYTVYDANGNPTQQTRSLSDTLALTQSVSRSLQGICDGFGLRLYNVVCCDQATFELLSSVLSGQTPASSIDPESLLGRIRSNLTPEGVLDFCGKVGAIDQSTIRSMAAPTFPAEANGSILARGSAQAFAAALAASSSGLQLDDRGYYVGTSYDQNGSPILDDYGNPAGALYDDAGNLIFDENGYLQFWGQQYDDRGNPVGTPYDDAGNPILDWNGNPYGTQYGDDGNPLRDWRGNMVIYS